ncbi:MAG TPA: cytochrome c3 family protein [Pyrinomonadaceae bacterium]|jgi:hypothetical protein|nr:cytochrome c3 family protein [Pyrinomonadaceae bacterium]
MKRRTNQLATLLLLTAAAAFLHFHQTSSAAPEPQRRRPPSRQRRRTPAPRVDYSRFWHRTAEHRRDSCASCHAAPTANWTRARSKDAAFPDVTDYPGHSSCLGCHRQQFFSGARPVICTVCHTAVSPRADARFPFQNPDEAFDASPKKGRRPLSDFTNEFPHDRHQDVMAHAVPPDTPDSTALFMRAGFAPRRQTASKPVDSCSICHVTYQPLGDSKDEYATKPPGELPEVDRGIKAYWLLKGTLKSTPTSHASCFNCHWQDGGERPFSNDCAGCHKLKPAPGQLTAPADVRKGDDADVAHPSAKAITDPEVLALFAKRRAARFRHEVSSHEELGCTACHIAITSSGGLNANTMYVPIQTCSSSKCHGGPKPAKDIYREVTRRRNPGPPDTQCVKCHVNYGKEPTPKSHSDLFPAPAK